MTLGQNSPGKDLRARYLWVGGAMILGLLLLAGRLYRLQITQGDEYAAKSVANFVKPIPIPADRGMILDRRGQILVENRASFDAFVTPAFCERCADDVLPRLGAYLGWDADELKKVTQLVKSKSRGPEKYQRIPVRVDLARDEMDVLFAHLSELAGVDIDPVPHRAYHAHEVLAHVVGYMNEISQDELEQKNAKGGDYRLGDYIGRRGVEEVFEPYLRGKDGVRKEVVDARGRLLPDLNNLISDDDRVEPVAGNNVVLSIDYRLQEAAEKAFPANAGAVIAVDVRTGFILAMVSRPAYDPNILTGRVSMAQLAEYNRDPLQPMRIHATQNHYSPGSTFKIITALAALQSQKYRPTSTVYCNGGYSLGSRRWRCDKETGHGSVDMKHAISQSCNTYFWSLADNLGLEPIARVAKDLGLGQPTGIGVMAEVPGIMPDEAYHNRVTPGGYTKGLALNSAIGQGDVNVTPLQLVMMYAAIGNGGNLYQPQLVRRVESPDGTVLQEYQPKLVRHLNITPEERQTIVEGLVAVVNEAGGTAYGRRLKDIVVAGKTGTAQVMRLGTVRVKAAQLDYWQRDNAWFASFAPADDPEIAVVVLNEHGGFGASGAAPAAMEVIQKYFDLKKEETTAARVPVQPVELHLPPKPDPPGSKKKDPAEKAELIPVPAPKKKVAADDAGTGTLAQRPPDEHVHAEEQ